MSAHHVIVVPLLQEGLWMFLHFVTEEFVSKKQIP